MKGLGVPIWIRIPLLVAVGFGGILALSASGDEYNGFDVSNASIPVAEILSGGPPRDGIPAIDEPSFISSEEAGFLQGDSRVIGVTRGKVAKAYPISILNWHEVVNDSLEGQPIAVTFCPLCGTGMVFLTPGKTTLGVSGLLYNSDVLLYDRATESLWSQIRKEAVSGPRQGEKLKLIPASHTSWNDWRSRHPNTLVLSPDTGHQRNYDRNPYYEEYARQRTLCFPVAHRDTRYHPKETVIGVDTGEVVKTWPFVELARSHDKLEDMLGSTPVVIEYDAEARTGRVIDANGQEVPSTLAFWFAWIAFHPDSQVWVAKC